MTTNFNQGAPCRVSADTAAHYRRLRDDTAAYTKRVQEIAARLAEAKLTDEDKLKELVYDHELDIFSTLARALRNLDQACDGNQNAVNSVLDALAEMERSLLRTALDSVTDEAERLAEKV